MKIQFIALFVFACFISFAYTEIEARFPGTQPIIVPGSDSSVISPTYDFETEDKLTIDSYSLNTSPPLVVNLPTSGAPPAVTGTAFDIGTGILGGERDIILIASEGESALSFSAGASGGSFTINTPNSGSGICIIQYDGIDSSPALDVNVGLQGVDLTADQAIGFRIDARSDVETEFTLTVIDSFGNQGSVTSFVEEGNVLQNYFINFDNFFGGVIFNSINVIEFEVQAFDNVDFIMDTFVTYGPTVNVPNDCITGVVLPCDTDYYRLETFTNVQVGDYLTISYDDVGEVDQFTTTNGKFYIVSSQFENLQEELASNANIIDTLGQLPGPTNYEYLCNGNCDVEIVWSQLQNATYYLAVEGNGDGNLVYQICLNYRSVPVFELEDGVPETIFFDERPTFPPRDNALHYRYFSIDIPQSSFSEGTYLVVNISRAEPFPGVGLRVMYEDLPEAAVDTGIIGEIDFNSAGARVDDTIFPFCVDTATVGRPPYDNPISSDPRIPCDCFTDVQLFGAGPAFQLTCQLVVDPCHFRYGKWYMSVELPERDAPGNPFDTSGETNYTITATTVQPSITSLIRNVTFKAFVDPEAIAHFKLDVPANAITPGESHLLVHLSNVRNGVVDIFVHQGQGIGSNLAGGPEGCVPANATCRSCDACNVVIEKCHFTPGTWYVSVGVVYDSDTSEFLVNDFDRLPVTFTLRANWMEDPTPSRLVAGVPVAKYIGEALYDFYVIDVPSTIDTWLFVELYAKANDTEVVLAILHDDIPGGECYARPDFYCMTGDPRGLTYDSGTPAYLDDDAVQRESCTFMIQTCELSPGPLYLSVYGHHTGYAAYGDTTFYQVPVHYTLWADFDVALSIHSGVSYSETVFENQYQHYYIRADQVQQGASLSVEVTNIQHGIPQTIEAFVNYNYLAGNCPCYDHLYNCTGAVPCSTADQNSALADVDSVLNCCTIVVPASDFRPGVWYIAVLGVNEDYFSYTTPIGYTLTATVHDAPTFNPLILGQAYQGDVPQWNKTLEYVNFRLAADAIPLNDLVFKATYVQNCDFMGKHDDTGDALWMYVNNGAPATEYLGGYVQKCKVDTTTQSYCTIVIPHCEWEGDNWFVAIQGKYDADFIGRFTLRASTNEVRDYKLTDGVSHYDRVSVSRYQHYFIDTNAEEDQYLSIDLYTNSDQDAVSVYLNKDERAGNSPCFDNFAVCETESCCTWQLHACDLEPGRYYISVYGSHSQFYDTSVEYTLTAAHKPVTTTLFNGDPFTGHLKQLGDVQHYRFEVADNVREGTFLSFEIDNVKHGAVTVYGQYEFLAGRCPCYIWEYTCTASDDPFGPAGQDWCEIRVPSCLLQPGEYFFSVWAIEMQSPDPPVFMTPIGYTIEINVVTPIIIDPFVELGRDTDNTEAFQFVDNGRYNHYEFSIDDDDFESGYHIIVEITSVRDGALFVYYNQVIPGDEDPNCHIAEICTSGLGSGTECLWQLPYCLVKPLGNGDKHYITVEGRTGRVTASYNILIYKQGVPSFISNDAFSLDDGLADAPAGAELQITHDKNHEPNGWTQFFRLTDVPQRLDSGKGEMLEVFFYRIRNNIGEPMSFNVYLHPNEPAGAHECCDDSNPSVMGSCQGAPCSNTADTTTQVNLGQNVFSHTCSLGSGIGTDSTNNALFGERCYVRVWPCEFNKYCTNSTTDWFMSVVPISPTELSSNGVGLQYDVQWRVRDIRLTESEVVGSIDLTSSINTYDYTSIFSVTSVSSESEGWISFYVDYENEVNSRLSIQTRFTNGEGIVYVQGDEFASYTDSCNMYTCGSGEDCAGVDRFYVSECCSFKHQRYYITVRNTGPVNSVTSVQFRIVNVQIPGGIQLDDHPSPSNPHVLTSGPSVFAGVSGVEGDNYDYYILTIDDDDLDRRQQWVVEVSRPDNDAGTLTAFIRFGAAPGQYGPDNAQGSYGTENEGCHGWQYTCSMEPGERCVWQIPHCSLIEGHWWIGLHNPNFDFSVPTNLPDYTLTTYINDPPLVLGLDEQVLSPPSADSALTQYYSFNITADEIDFDERDEITGYWTKYLRFQLDNVVGGVATMYISYNSLPGIADDGGDACLGLIGLASCDSQCFVDFTPCEIDGSAFKLKTGTYIVGVEHTPGTSYALTTRVYRDDYQVIPLSDTIVGTGNRLGAIDNFYTHTATSTELNAGGDGDGNYRYVIDIANEDDDDLADNKYLVFNFTVNAFAGNDESVHYDVWRDDCTRFSCDTTGPLSWCTIDALELAPCSAKGGRYFIRVENPSSVTFSVNLYYNETVIQEIQDFQIITEIIYPYEYQEYYYEAVDVGQGSTLTVNICSICGDVEAFIRPDLPAGPVPDNTGYEKSCSIDHCAISGPDDTTFELENNCCSLFLDTCQYEQRGYYIGVRGVNMVYPNVRNDHLYIPIKYNIQPIQTNINVTDISFSSCPQVVNYVTPWSSVPRQFAIDIESFSVGSMLRFSLRLPTDFATASAPAHLYIQANETVGFSDGCPLDGPYDMELSCSTSTSCSFIVPYCKLAPYCGSRYYIWADAPRGSEVLVERWDPYVPILHADVQYHGSINGPSPVDYDLPWTPNHQIYRFDLNPQLNIDANYYEKFFVRVIVSHVSQGELAFSVNSGHYPYVSDTGCGSPMFLDTSSCTSVGDGEECWVEIQYSTLLSAAGGDEHDIPHSFWLTVFGVEQTCELHSIKYSFVVQTNWVLTYYPVGETICNNVDKGQYNFHRLKPRTVETPQESILKITVSDLDVDESVKLLVNDHYLASSLDNTPFIASSGSEGVIDVKYICGYDDLYLSVYGEDSNSGSIDYKMSVEKVSVRVKDLMDDSIYYADDDDDDACPHVHDFYRFRTAWPNGHNPGSFFRVLVDSEFPTRVYVNKGDFAWEGCADSGYGENDPSVTGTTSVNVYDFCNFEDGTYFITVVSDGPYYIYTDVRDDAKELTLGEVFHDVVEPGMYQMYTLEICDDWFEADDRLVVEISDVDNGDVYGWIRLNGNAGDPDEFGYNTCSENTAFADYGSGESGYDFLLVNHCSLNSGTYYILIRGSPHEGSPERDCEHVTFRLFPYLIDLQIDPVEIRPNTPIFDTVDAYNINRIVAGHVPFHRYYKVHPLQEGDGYYEQVSQAVVRVYNVEGGLLNTRVMCDHLATSLGGQIDGEIYGLTSTSADDFDYVPGTSGLANPSWKMQSGRFPGIPLLFMDYRESVYQPECTGCSDFCCKMTFDDLDQYITDKSCAIWVPSCYFIWADFYIVVNPNADDDDNYSQNAQDHFISYNLEVEQTRDFILLQPDHNKVSSFENDNWDYDFYYSISSEPQSMRWRIVVTQGEGVLVTVRNHRCPLQATWAKDIWCDASYFDRPWMCDIEIPTKAAHPGDNAYFVSVNGKNATYSIAFWRGRENCHSFTGSGRNEGLDFCAGLVPYGTWRWDSYRNLDNEAECFFEELYQHFRVQPCYTGVTPECNATLQSFACHESFRRCDEFGFYTGTCRDSCEAVVYECANWFESVDLEHYNCTSNRYIDSHSATCTGNPTFSTIDPQTQNFFGNEPDLLLFKSSPSSSDSSSLNISLLLCVISTLFALLF